MNQRRPSPADPWALLVVPAVLAFLLWALWPSAAERAHWREIRSATSAER